ncbi:MAG: type II toxin-antitoxin system HicA family toxin [Candidatus Dadabacteria bacterium]|nr:type II toxin-antitoxin system HicA family toxin [Candidatus Dadabacteria bacterium]
MESYTPRVKKILQDNQCYFYRQGKGDHEYWWSPITCCHVTVDGKIKSRHLANKVLKQAGISKKF